MKMLTEAQLEQLLRSAWDAAMNFDTGPDGMDVEQFDIQRDKILRGLIDSV
jgi:hypothetical protein